MIHEQLNWKIAKSGPVPEQIGLGTFTLQLAKDTLVIKGVCVEKSVSEDCVWALRPRKKIMDLNRTLNVPCSLINKSMFCSINAFTTSVVWRKPIYNQYGLLYSLYNYNWISKNLHMLRKTCSRKERCQVGHRDQ